MNQTHFVAKSAWLPDLNGWPSFFNDSLDPSFSAPAWHHPTLLIIYMRDFEFVSWDSSQLCLHYTPRVSQSVDSQPLCHDLYHFIRCPLLSAAFVSSKWIPPWWSLSTQDASADICLWQTADCLELILIHGFVAMWCFVILLAWDSWEFIFKRSICFTILCLAFI